MRWWNMNDDELGQIWGITVTSYEVKIHYMSFDFLGLCIVIQLLFQILLFYYGIRNNMMNDDDGGS